MNRSKLSHSGLSSDQTPREVVGSPGAVVGASQDVEWRYSDSPVRRSKVAKASEGPGQLANTPVRIIKRHVSSPLPDNSSKALQHSRKLKTLVEFETLSNDSDDDSSFNFSADFDITEDELAKVIEEADKKAKQKRLVNLTSTALPSQQTKRKITDEVPVPLPKRMSEPELLRSQVTPRKSKAPATKKEDFPIDLDDSYDNAVLSSIPIELLSGRTQSSRAEIKFDPKRNLSQIVTPPVASSSKPASGSSEKKFFKSRLNPVSQDIPLNMTQKLQIAENRRQALKRLEETKRRQQNKRNQP